MNCLAACLLPLLAAPVGAPTPADAPPSADPWVLRVPDGWLYLRTTGGDIRVAKAAALADIGTAEAKVVWQPPAAGPCSRNLWAPELHQLDGRWYIYFAADDGHNEQHRMWVLQADTDDPQGSYHLVGKLTTPDDHWAIDGTVCEWQGQRYFIWSGWQGDRNERQDLYIAKLASPTALSGERVRIARPSFPWERFGLPIDEGPQALIRGGTLRVVFSASGFWRPEYCLGLLTLKAGGDPLDPKAWTKLPQPVFKASPSVKGPGHGSFTTDAEGRDWLVYHAHAPGQPAGHVRRVLKLQRFDWAPDGAPRFGVPE